jgi:hypothetical protein
MRCPNIEPAVDLFIMYSFLAYADSSDPSSTNLLMIVGGILILAVVVILAFVLVIIAKAKEHRRADAIMTAAFFWAILTAATLLYTGQAQMRWSKEYNLQLETGYLDPSNQSSRPDLPWKIWIGLGVAYGAMLVWSLSQKRDSRTPI